MPTNVHELEDIYNETVANGYEASAKIQGI